MVQYPAGKTATSYSIPSSVKTIKSYAFAECSNLTSMTIPSNVTTIGSYAFYYCNRVTRITIPSSVTNIGNYAFEYCSKLTSATIGNGVQSIGAWAFANCTSLSKINYKGTRAQWSAIDKGGFWNDKLPSGYTIVCSDGTPCATHTYGEYTVTQNATCTETGSKYQTCSVCGYVNTVIISKLAHTYGDFTITKEATCTETGSKYQTCSVCSYVNEITIPIQHSFVDGFCTECGTGDGKSFDSAIIATLGNYTAMIASDSYVHSNNKIALYKFVAPESKIYTFQGTNASTDVYDWSIAYLYDSSKSQIAYSSYVSSNNYQFKINHYCTAGETYYIGVGLYYPYASSGTIPFSIS